MVMTHPRRKLLALEVPRPLFFASVLSVKAIGRCPAMALTGKRGDFGYHHLLLAAYESHPLA